jgi:hypothetical protein
MSREMLLADLWAGGIACCLISDGWNLVHSKGGQR